MNRGGPRPAPTPKPRPKTRTGSNSAVERMVSLQVVRAALEEVLREATKHPNDCLECIANDALISFGIPLIVSKSDEDDCPYPVSITGWAG